ncbi:putative ubiquitin-protein ligase [Hibiscus syriacus]|uniref:Ubiquitin-protein ligase n=1 Tax=Hibiscus syriacus TaxID=106335 RepID=A0A6A3BAM9_HIBSY|nr:putative ubiquitin-protein ligase [Hibiscus syriacus]
MTPRLIKAFGWVLEMYAYAVASALNGVQHTSERLYAAAAMGFEIGKKFIIHYTYGCDYNMKGELTYGKIGEWRFDNKIVFTWTTPTKSSLPPPGVPESVVSFPTAPSSIYCVESEMIFVFSVTMLELSHMADYSSLDTTKT